MAPSQFAPPKSLNPFHTFPLIHTRGPNHVRTLNSCVPFQSRQAMPSYSYYNVKEWYVQTDGQKF